MTHDYTGHLYEVEKLGRCTATSRGYMKFRASLDFARAHQPRSKRQVAAQLEREVSKRLGGWCDFYTAVRTPLDVYHGVDGFFELDGIVVTVDVTMNSRKDSCKADVLVCREDLADLPALAGRIAREFKTKERRRNW